MRRISSLDGLRGVAALVVVVHHSLLSNPSLAEAYVAGHEHDVSGAAWALSFTPLHLVWAGTEAVWVFFILSGLVLTLPHADGGARASWVSYYLRRAIRIYLPLWAALALAAAIVAVTVRPGPDASWWLGAHHGLDGTTPAGIAQDALLFPVPGTLTTVLWSLKWEIVFSAALPLFVLAGRASRRVPIVVLGIVAVVLLTAGDRTGFAPLAYLPIFAIGTVLAFRRSWVEARTRNLSDRAAAALAVLAVVALLAPWLARGDDRVASALADLHVESTFFALSVLGATVVVVLAWQWRALADLLARPSVRWLGTRSFSLYLVHEPIAVAVGAAAGGATLVVLPVTLTISFAVAELFHRWVEAPAIALSRRVGRAVGATPRAEAVEP